jgi:hypothetical protein
LTPTRGVVKPACDETGILEERPGSFRVTSITALTATDSTAGKQVFSRDSGLKFLVTGNADSVAHCFHSAKSPARSAGRLITDLLDGFTVRPCCSGIEITIDVLKWINVLLGKLHVLRSLESTHESFNLIHRLAIKVVIMASLPGDIRQRVNVFDDASLIE